MPAVLFGSISTIVDTSELQREAFNQAFKAHGRKWTWKRDTYQAMLDSSGGEKRIDNYARYKGQKVDAKAIHQTKSEIFRTLLSEASLSPRAGVAETIQAAKSAGFKVGFVSSTSAENVAALLSAVSAQIDAGDFDVIVDASKVSPPKPNPAVYEFALSALGEDAKDCVAIEDNVEGVSAAQAAGVRCVAMPNENTAGHDFGSARLRVEKPSFDELRSLVAAQ